MLLIFMQKIIFIPVLFLEILQRYYKRSPKTMASTSRKFLRLLQTKNQLDPSMFFTDITLYRVVQSAIGQENISENNSTIKLLSDIDFFVLLHLHVEHFYLFFPYFKLFLSIILSGILTSSSWL